MNDAVLVRHAKLSVHPYTVAPCVEASLVPAHLRHHLRRLRVVVQVRLQLNHLVLAGHPYIVAQSLEFLSELRQRVQLFHVEVKQHLLPAACPLQLVEAARPFAVLDMEERAHGKIAPLHVAVVRHAVIAASVFYEAIRSQVNLLALGFLRIYPRPFGAVDGRPPYIFPLFEFHQFVYEHFNASFVLDQRGEVGDARDVLRLAIHVVFFIPPFPCAPRHELFLLEQAELCF